MPNSAGIVMCIIAWLFLGFLAFGLFKGYRVMVYIRDVDHRLSGWRLGNDVCGLLFLPFGLIGLALAVAVSLGDFEGIWFCLRMPKEMMWHNWQHKTR